MPNNFYVGGKFMNKAGFILSVIMVMVGMAIIAVGIILNLYVGAPMAYAAGRMISSLTGLYTVAGIMLGIGVIFAIIFYVAYARAKDR